MTSASSPAVWGASVGNDHLVLGWFRDAVSEPPDWTVRTMAVYDSLMNDFRVVFQVYFYKGIRF